MLLTGDEEWEGIKMGEEERDMASDERASSCLKGQRLLVWSQKY